ncbi:MAG: A/G-specific adenine glycosylase [Desulfobulbaceae bacterium]|nr:A/G-specific adenine glycosylase [Desulfobulbaceae bacterium]
MVTNSTFTQNILSWFAEKSRDLPWRRTYEPYQVWISEIMLQQTQVDRVISFFSRWLERFPDIQSLSTAHEDEVLRFWEGLGYYSRARNLHKASKILAENNEDIPCDYKKLLKLPGIGPYTAGALMSIAFNQDFPVVDANVERVFSRLFDISTPIKSKRSKDFIWQKAAEILPSGKSRFFNQALMELGALVCLPKIPLCSQCPVQEHCYALKHHTVHERPVLPSPKKYILIEMATGIVMRKGKYLIQKRLEDDVWANLWEFPGGRLKKGETAEQALIREFKEETEFEIRPTKKITTVSHSYMQYRVKLHGFFCEEIHGDGEREAALNAAQENRWVAPAQLHEFAFPSGHRKLINHLLKTKETGQ